MYGRPPIRRVRALAAVDAEGGLLGIGGIERQPSGACLFLDIAEGVDARRHRRTLIRAVRRVLGWTARDEGRVFAIRDADRPTSAAFLEHFGFAPLGGAQLQEVWIWVGR